MKRLVALFLLLALALPVAAVENDEVMYVGGTVLNVNASAVGRFDTTSESVLVFDHPGGKLSIPYADIQSFQYSTEVTRHLGVLPAIAVGLLRAHEHRHFFRISYRDDKGRQVAIFEVSKQMPRTLQPVLESRIPKTCRPSACRTQQR